VEVFVEGFVREALMVYVQALHRFFAVPRVNDELVHRVLIVRTPDEGKVQEINLLEIVRRIPSFNILLNAAFNLLTGVWALALS
jgi:hypothetical protein